LLTGHARYDAQGNIVGCVGLNVDLNQRKSMGKELKEAYDFMNKIVQSSPNSISATDMRGNILIWNQATEETLGYKASEVVGKMKISKIYPEGVARKVLQMIRSDEFGGVGRLRSYPMVNVRRDGVVVEGNLSAAIIYDANGREIATVGSFVDLTDRLQMERALRDTQEQLLKSEKLAAMGRLTSQIAHELNNPLYGIMNTLELLKTEIPADNKRRKILDMAHSEIIRLSDLLRKMLSFSKPDQEERHPVDINSVLDEILLLHENMFRENDINIVTTFAERLGLVNASKNQLRQVFLNMVANARDAMPEGGTLAVATGGDTEKVYVVIVDTGTGIREKHLDKIFDSFFTTRGEVKGVGLGLSVCYGFIKDHGGDIEVKSRVGEGTTFTISLPVYTAPESSQDDSE
jgi:two-component system NtrC family sensor kinase